MEIPDAQKHYIEKDDYNRFIYHNREQDAAERTILVMHDAEKLLEICEGDFMHPKETVKEALNHIIWYLNGRLGMCGDGVQRKRSFDYLN